MQAIIETGGKQYAVEPGTIIYAEKLPFGEGDDVVFDRVLYVTEGEEAWVGAPYVAGASVEAHVVKNGKGKKIRVYKYNAKKNYRRTQGHRQPYTQLQIDRVIVEQGE